MIKLRIIPTVVAFALIATFTVCRSEDQRKEKKEKEIPSRISEINLEPEYETTCDFDVDDLDLTPKKR